MQWNARSENLRENRRKCSSAEGLHKYYTDYRNPQKNKQTPYYLWTTKVSFSCRHPTHLSTPCEVTFSSYLPRHMTGGSHQTRKTEQEVAWTFPELKGPLGSLLKATIRQTAGEIRCRDNAWEEGDISKAHRALLPTEALLLTKSNPGWREALSCDQTNAARGKDTNTALHCKPRPDT